MQQLSILYGGRTRIARSVLETANSRTLGFEEIRDLIGKSPFAKEIVYLILFHRRFRPESWQDRLELFRWISSSTDFPFMLQANAAISLAYTALHLGDIDTAQLAEVRSRETLDHWEEMPEHPRTGKKNRIHLYFSQVSVGWPVHFLSGSEEQARLELERGRTFFLGLEAKRIDRPVFARIVQSLGRLTLADSVLAFLREDFDRVEENNHFLWTEFRRALDVIPSDSNVKHGFLKATKVLAWNAELMRISTSGSGTKERSQSRADILSLSFEASIRITGAGRAAAMDLVAQRFRGTAA